MSSKLKITPPPAQKSNQAIIKEINDITDETIKSMRMGCSGALRVGFRLLILHRETGDTEAPGGFRAALDALSSKIPPSTAYRWLNAASTQIARMQDVTDIGDMELPAFGTKEFSALEGELEKISKGMSIRRLTMGSVSPSDESRLDNLISLEESGDREAAKVLEAVSAGRMTLVQAIRAQAGATAKQKGRADAKYLYIDGATGKVRGLFVNSLVTISRAFAQWDDLEEPARNQVKLAWKETVAHLPKELR